jgi:hypothetical protein
MSKESDFQEILENGINFGRGGGPRQEDDKVRTKAKKKKYITGAHGSGSARQKPNTVNSGLTGTRNRERPHNVTKQRQKVNSCPR